MSGKHNKVPKLRFPEFRDAGAWEEKTLGHLCDYWNGASHEGAVTENGDYHLISLNSIDIEGNLKSDMKRLPHTDNSLQRNDLIMVLSDVAHGNFLGLTDIIPGNHFILNQRMAGLRIRNLYSVNIGFLRIYINYNQKYFKQKGQGSSQLNLSKSSVTEFPVLLPSPKEQQKIADCLSFIDDLITAQTQKLDSLKAHKKGLMQQLFPAEGETAPKLRFPEFRDAGDWEEKPLAELISTVTPPKKLLTADYSTAGLFPIIDQSQDFICGWTNDGEAVIHDTFPLIVFGDHTCALKIVNQPFAQGADGIKILKTNPSISSEYLYQFLQFNPLVMEDYKRHFSILKDKKILFPDIESEEQKEIADCLSSIDDLITAQAQKLDTLKSHKKGLMQQLFPAPLQ